ncbi:MAG: glycosyl hydrolase [Candidatus Brocadiia bacterium]
MKTILWPATLCCCILLAWGAAARAAEPCDPDLIPEARRVLEYLHSVYGKKTLAGTNNHGNAATAFAMAGRKPAIHSFDASGWNRPKWGETYRRVLARTMDHSQEWWEKQGGIVTMQWHWITPGSPKGSAWGGRDPRGRIDVGKVVTPGTEEHKAAMEDLKLTADYLQGLADARVPVLWRPLHEIDGGWFWWTDKETPENTAKLWRMVFDYLVEERDFHNLIWVYSAGLKTNVDREAPLAEKIAFRKRHYPGPEYVDIAGIDIYPNAYFGWSGDYDDTYPKAMQIIQAVAPGKIYALCEGRSIPSPDVMQEQGPVWLYSLTWYVGGVRANPAEWVRKTYTHEGVVTLDELPDLAEAHNTLPDVRIAAPADGAHLPAGAVALEAEAGDRDGKVARVEFRLLGPQWWTWPYLPSRTADELLEASTLIGAVAAPPYRVEWKPKGPGLYSVIAQATDEDGAASWSNLVRLAVGVENAAAGRTCTASSREEHAGRATDGDVWTAWAADRKAEDPQWLAIDLGAPRSLGAALVVWGKAHGGKWAVQVSDDGETWKTVAEGASRSCQPATVTFPPVETRHVRLLCIERGTNWGSYNVEEFAVYRSLPAAAEEEQ